MGRNLTQKPNTKEFWQIAKESASLSAPRGRLVSFGAVLTILFILPTDKLYLIPVKSIYETVFGWVPYSSGMTRGVSSILHGEIGKAWEYNPLSFAVMAAALGIMIVDGWRVFSKEKHVFFNADC